jgi:hypothetical protein
MDVSLQYLVSNVDAALEMVECWIYDIPTSNIPPREIKGSELDSWLATPAPSHGGEQPISGLRLVGACQMTTNTLPFTQAQLDALVGTSSLQSLIHGIIATPASVAVRLSSENLNPGKMYLLTFYSKARQKAFSYNISLRKISYAQIADPIYSSFRYEGNL